MHAVFMLNGKKELVDKLIKYLETRIFYLPFANPQLRPDGPKGKDGSLLAQGAQPIDGVLRYGLFGTWEYVFPKESMNAVLTFLNFNKEVKAENYNTPLAKNAEWIGNAKMKARLKVIQKALALDPIPEFEEDHSMLYPDGLKDHVRIIPLGIRHDTVGEINGIIHERL